MSEATRRAKLTRTCLKPMAETKWKAAFLGAFPLSAAFWLRKRSCWLQLSRKLSTLACAFEKLALLFSIRRLWSKLQQRAHQILMYRKVTPAHQKMCKVTPVFSQN